MSATRESAVEEGTIANSQWRFPYAEEAFCVEQHELRCNSKFMLTALKILADVAAFRLKRLEMANLFAAVSIMLALGLSIGEFAYRLCFGLMLNLLVYLHNDYCDVDQDLGSAKKDLPKARYLKAHKKEALVTQLVLIGFLAATALAISPGLLVALIAGGGICWLYSSKIKRVPYLDVVAMILAGAFMPLVGMPLDSILGWSLVAQLALTSGSFQSIQVMRDHEDDSESCVKTTAVLLGLQKTRLLARGFLLLLACYTIAVLNIYIGAALFVALFIPVGKDYGTYWNRIRMVTGLAWLGIIGWVFWFKNTAGLLVSIDMEDKISWLNFLQ